MGSLYNPETTSAFARGKIRGSHFSPFPPNAIGISLVAQIPLFSVSPPSLPPSIYFAFLPILLFILFARLPR